jgi:hypothetical protein
VSTDWTRAKLRAAHMLSEFLNTRIASPIVGLSEVLGEYAYADGHLSIGEAAAKRRTEFAFLEVIGREDFSSGDE